MDMILQRALVAEREAEKLGFQHTQVAMQRIISQMANAASLEEQKAGTHWLCSKETKQLQ